MRPCGSYNSAANLPRVSPLVERDRGLRPREIPYQHPTFSADRAEARSHYGKRRVAMSDFLFDLLRPDRLTAVVDVGANPINSSPPYKPLLEKRLCRVLGFEPQPTALAMLNSQKTDLETYLPDVIGDGNAGLLKVCRDPGMTSLLVPDPQMLRLFAGFPEWGHVTQEIPVMTRRLDDVSQIEAIDLLKMDIQGSELSLLQNGRECLKNTVAIQTEVSFIPLYKDQPTFGDLDKELRHLGFVPHCFVEVKKRLIQPLFGSSPYDAMNQLLEADVLYVRDFTKAERMSSEQLKQLAIIAHHCYGSFDLATNCVHHLAKVGAAPSDVVKQYVTDLEAANLIAGL
jgi:FkbM family methyltransferase